MARFNRSKLAAASLLAGGLALVSLGAVPAAAQVEPASAVALSMPAFDPAFAQFEPSSDRIEHQIDYTAWDEAMRYIVFPMGRSLRQTPGSPAAGLGTRRVWGHDSRYRLEGNRVMFSFFDDDLKNSVRQYRQELEGVPSQVEFNRIPRNEQLAFWINLHNAALIDQIAHNWPVRQPSEIEIDGVPLDLSKFITVNGVAMSLNDIRTQIVYRNWRDPRVIYGFWRGDIGGPSIQRGAFTADNMNRLLDRGAGDFINSLRGVQKRSNRLQVSKIYEEAAPFFFPDFGSDLRAHIAEHAESDVQTILGQTQEVEAAIYEPDIADLAGGAREPTYNTVTTDGIAQSFRIPQGMARLLQEYDTKQDRITKEGRTGTVIFSDIQLPGEEPVDNEVK